MPPLRLSLAPIACADRQGLLEGIAAVEARAYAVLADFGATPLTKVLLGGIKALEQVVVISGLIMIIGGLGEMQ